jgi:hypothetical protein
VSAGKLLLMAELRPWNETTEQSSLW